MSEHRRSSTEGAAVSQELVEEVSRALAIESPKRDGSKFWHYIGAVLAAIVTASVLAGGLGRAFFASKDDFTNGERTNAVEHEHIRQTLVRVEQALAAQTAAFNRLQDTVQAQAVELARRK